MSEEKGVTYRDEAHLKIQQDRKLHYKQLRNKWLQARKQEVGKRSSIDNMSVDKI